MSADLIDGFRRIAKSGLRWLLGGLKWVIDVIVVDIWPCFGPKLPHQIRKVGFTKLEQFQLLENLEAAVLRDEFPC